MRVLIPSPLLSYTRVREVSATGATLGALLADLDAQYPGLRFRMVDEQDRIRPHMRVFVDGRQVHDLDSALSGRETVQIIQALSGG